MQKLNPSYADVSKTFDSVNYKNEKKNRTLFFGYKNRNFIILLQKPNVFFSVIKTEVVAHIGTTLCTFEQS